MPEINKHGVQVLGVQPSDGADGKSEDAIVGSSLPPANPSLTAARKAIHEKPALSIADITGDVNSSNSSEDMAEENAAIAEEDPSIVSPLESPYVLVQGTPVHLTHSDNVEENHYNKSHHYRRFFSSLITT